MDLQTLRDTVADGRFFSVEFIKRTDGQKRKMLARVGVKRDLKGHGAAYDPAKHDLLMVFDVQKRGYRTIPVENITKLKAGGVEYNFGLATRGTRAY